MKKLEANYHEAWIKFATYFSVTTAILIIAFKIYGYLETESVAMLASLADSLLDLFASIINLVAVRLTFTPATQRFRYGFSRAEDLAIFIQSSLIVISGIYLIMTSIHRMIDSVDLKEELSGIYVILFSMGLTFILVTFQKFVIRKTNSKIIQADYLHYIMDFTVNASVIVSLIISYNMNINFVDNIVGLVIAFYIIYSASDLLKKAVINLLDHEITDEERNEIEKIIFARKEILEVHDFKSRVAGPRLFLQFHVELDGDLTLKQAHLIVEDIEQKILKHFPKAEVIIHKDPYGIEDHKKEYVAERKVKSRTKKK